MGLKYQGQFPFTAVAGAAQELRQVANLVDADGGGTLLFIHLRHQYVWVIQFAAEPATAAVAAGALLGGGIAKHGSGEVPGEQGLAEALLAPQQIGVGEPPVSVSLPQLLPLALLPRERSLQCGLQAVRMVCLGLDAHNVAWFR